MSSGEQTESRLKLYTIVNQFLFSRVFRDILVGNNNVFVSYWKWTKEVFATYEISKPWHFLNRELKIVYITSFSIKDIWNQKDTIS